MSLFRVSLRDRRNGTLDIENVEGLKKKKKGGRTPGLTIYSANRSRMRRR